jgi:imidazolonepropionase-like amidohydrolase
MGHPAYAGLKPLGNSPDFASAHIGEDMNGESLHKNKLDIAITGGTLVTMKACMEIIEDSFVGIKDGVIVAAGQKGDQRYADGPAKETIEASGCIVMP